jgi:hypothetical protein
MVLASSGHQDPVVWGFDQGGVHTVVFEARQLKQSLYRPLGGAWSGVRNTRHALRFHPHLLMSFVEDESSPFAFGLRVFSRTRFLSTPALCWPAPKVAQLHAKQSQRNIIHKKWLEKNTFVVCQPASQLVVLIGTLVLVDHITPARSLRALHPHGQRSKCT